MEFAQIVAACYEMNLIPEKVVKFSGMVAPARAQLIFLGRSLALMGCTGYAFLAVGDVCRQL